MSDYDLLQDDVYSIRLEGAGLRVTKFTKDLNPVAFYYLDANAGDGSYKCNCPQSNRGPCKHLDIVDAFDLYPERIDKGWFYCHHTGDWYPPVEQEAFMPSWMQPGSGSHNPPQFKVDDLDRMTLIESVGEPPLTPADDSVVAVPSNATLSVSEVEGALPPSGTFNRRGL